ncbi:hypothetical protein Dimus_003185 [Dionaea muscipula]
MLVHVDAVKEFYAKMTVIHLKKKDVVKSSVKGISIEFDHERLATILGVPGRTGICEYIKEVWEESSGENRRRDNDEDAPEEEAEKEDERNKDDFDWEAVIDEATFEGESGSDDQFYDAQVEVEEPVMKLSGIGDPKLHLQLSRKIKNLQESTPRAPLVDFQKLNF